MMIYLFFKSSSLIGDDNTCNCLDKNAVLVRYLICLSYKNSARSINISWLRHLRQSASLFVPEVVAGNRHDLRSRLQGQLPILLSANMHEPVPVWRTKLILSGSSICNSTIGKSPEIEYPHKPDCPLRFLIMILGSARKKEFPIDD